MNNKPEKIESFDKTQDKQFQEKPEEEFELSYESFDQEAELKKLKKGNKETRAERLKGYKEELIKQKQGIAEIQLGLEKQIRDNPELDQQELMKTVWAKAPEYRLSENQLDLFKQTLDKYTEKHQAVREARKKYPNDKKLFKACFGKEPRGVIEVMEGPMTLYFRCHNLKDFTWIYQEKCLDDEKEQKIAKSDIKKAKKIRGCSAPYCLIPSLENTITAESAGGKPFVSPKARGTFKHEEQHAIKGLYKEQQLRNLMSGLVIEMPVVKKEIIEEFKNLKSPKTLVNYLKYRREYYENSAKNEILAFYKEGFSFKKIKEYLKEKKECYDYYNKHKRDLKKTLKEKLTPEIFNKNKRAIEKISEQVFVKEYKQEINKAINAMEELEKMGKSRNEIIYLLITEPLSRWKKLAERIKEAKK